MNDSISNNFRYIVVISSMLSIMSCIFLKLSLLYGFLFSILLTIGLLVTKGFKLGLLLNIGFEGLKECSTIISIILIIGAVISVWMSSGIIATMIYYGLKFIDGTNYLLICFIISTITSIVMGTPLGTLSTVGIALLGMGKGALIPEPVLLGAIISGSFVADKISPVSGLLNLTMKTTGVKYKESLGTISKTLIPIIVICFVIYYLLGEKFIANISPIVVNSYQENIARSFYTSPLLLLLPIAVIFLSLLGSNTISNLSLGLILGSMISIFSQKMSFLSLMKSIFYGYEATTGMNGLNEILSGGGIFSMIEICLIIIGAVILSSLFEGCNIIYPLIKDMLNKIKTTGLLIRQTSFLSAILTFITTDQTVGIILLGKVLQKKYDAMKIDKPILARTIIDTGVSIPPLIPWNITAIIITTITGITVSEYGIYAILCYISPVVTIVFGYTEVTMENLGITNKI
ncbi:Na+/H+ antiporter NhaC family protein [Anaeromicrobium sediminis]|uniref:Na+/H+ antiporter NhaC-like C-terminal domain-containing protein n=1 Tax=Anaeromicrobium sediminis TaxID=1478221 RepID=A0A267M8T2_9FIRM|nr:Na+/H+ antiporter NhaC family protein [Anaeromicrobium sediminis]PAB55994.1 hypothetical protein CCE28_21335 [Anaeromicrobium sediminis]